jgi:hypothetical protein
MPRYQYVVLSRAVAGREQEFKDWYDGRHLADVRRITGVVSARRYDVTFQKVYDLDAPEWQSLAIYEIETDDPEAFLAEISRLAGTDAMPLSDAMTMGGLVQVVARSTQ